MYTQCFSPISRNCIAMENTLIDDNEKRTDNDNEFDTISVRFDRLCMLKKRDYETVDHD